MKNKRTSVCFLAFLAGASASAWSQSAYCSSGIRDQSMPVDCILAGTVPVQGQLYPLSSDLFVDALGNVGIGTVFPTERLDLIGDFASQDITIQSANDPYEGVLRLDTTTVGDFRVIAGVDFGLPFLQTHAPGGKTNCWITNPFSANSGGVYTFGPTSYNTVMEPRYLDYDAAFMGTFDCNNDPLVVMSTYGDVYSGELSVFSHTVYTGWLCGYWGEVYGLVKTFVQPHPNDPSKELTYVSQEGPEHAVYFRGTAELSQGVSRIAVPASFGLVARPEDLTVILTPLGPTSGLYTESSNLNEIVVAENLGGPGTAKFDYYVLGLRAAMPPLDPIRENVRFRPSPETGEPLELVPSLRELLERNGTLHPDGTVDEATAARLGWVRENGRWVDSAPFSRRQATGTAGAAPRHGVAEPSSSADSLNRRTDRAR